MNKGVEPCPKCKKIPKALDLSNKDLGFTVGCMTEGCKYYFIAKAHTLGKALYIWNTQASLKKKGKRK